MGNSLARFWKLLGYNEELRVIMLGRDNAGKTTILYQLKWGQVMRSIPTIGFNVETITYRSVSFTVWDVGNGGDKLYPLWGHYFQNGGANQPLIFVVDSTDRERIPEIVDILHGLLNGPHTTKLKKLLVLANKQDLPEAMSVTDVREKMSLQNVRPSIRWDVLGSCATTGEGLWQAFDWLIDTKS